jgi:chemotaxis receptor (MCP) glutamine deamidase CheD
MGIGRKLQRDLREVVGTVIAVLKWQVHRHIRALKHLLVPVQKPVEHPVEVRGRGGEGGMEEIFNALLQLRDEDGGEHDRGSMDS